MLAVHLGTSLGLNSLGCITSQQCMSFVHHTICYILRRGKDIRRSSYEYRDLVFVQLS